MRQILVVSSVLLSLGCNNPVTPVDGGNVAIDMGPTEVDGGHDAATVAVDAAIDAATIASDAAIVCSPTCTTGHECVRGTCVLTCGADMSTFGAQLAAGVTVLQSVCHTPAAITLVGDHVYELASATAGAVTTFTLTRWTRGNEAPTVSTVGTAMFTVPASGDMTFAGGFVAVSADEMHALFGYTTAPADSTAMSVGGVFDMATGTGIATSLAAQNNYDATFIDATHYMVNTAPASAQGLYRAAVGDTAFTQAADHLGDFSGSVEVFGTSLLAGGTSFGAMWADGTTSGSRVAVFDLAAVTSTSAVISGATVTQLTMPSSFEMLSGGRAASPHYDSSFAIDGIQIRMLTRSSSGTVTVGDPTNLTTGASFTTASAAGTDIALGFTGGLLFVH